MIAPHLPPSPSPSVASASPPPWRDLSPAPAPAKRRKKRRSRVASTLAPGSPGQGDPAAAAPTPEAESEGGHSQTRTFGAVSSSSCLVMVLCPPPSEHGVCQPCAPGEPRTFVSSVDGRRWSAFSSRCCRRRRRLGSGCRASGRPSRALAARSPASSTSPPRHSCAPRTGTRAPSSAQSTAMGGRRLAHTRVGGEQSGAYGPILRPLGC